jgi:hypothetical protein
MTSFLQGLTGAARGEVRGRRKPPTSRTQSNRPPAIRGVRAMCPPSRAVMGAAVGSFGRRRPGRFGRDFVKKSRHAGANRALPRSVKTVSLEARWRPHSPQEPTPKIMLSRTLLTSALVVSSLCRPPSCTCSASTTSASPTASRAAATA